MLNLKLGSIGTDVKTLQKLLIEKGYNCGIIDGRFGPATQAQVMFYQKDNGLTVDGLVGPATWASLLKTTTPIISTPTNFSIEKFKTATIIKTEPKNIEIIVANKIFSQTTSKNIINGTYFWQGNPNGIIVNNGKILCADASHAWRGFPQSVLYFDGNEVNVKRILNAKELGLVDWAIGGLGMITPYGYSPTKEGFSGTYSDVLNTRNKTVIGFKNNNVYLMVIPTISHGNLLNLLKELGLEKAISLDGGGSTVMRANGKNIISSTRVINNWVIVK